MTLQFLSVSTASGKCSTSSDLPSSSSVIRVDAMVAVHTGDVLFHNVWSSCGCRDLNRFLRLVETCNMQHATCNKLHLWRYLDALPIESYSPGSRLVIPCASDSRDNLPENAGGLRRDVS